MALLTLGTGLGLLIASPVTALWPRARYGCRRIAMTLWGRGALWLSGARLTIVGQIPKRPFFLVCNHMSTADIFALAAATGGRFVGKAELGSWPFVGKVISGIGTILIDRSRRTAVGEVNRVLAEAMEAGESILLFVEGGIFPGDRLYPFQPSLLQPAVELGRPVHYALLHYSTPPGEPTPSQVITWPADKPALAQFRDLLGLRRYSIRLTLGSRPIQAADRKQLAQDLRNAMDPLFEAVP